LPPTVTPTSIASLAARDSKIGDRIGALLLLAHRIDAHDGVLAAVGEQPRAVGPGDDAVRGGPIAEGNALELAARTIKRPGDREVLAIPHLSARGESPLGRSKATPGIGRKAR